MNPLGWAIAVAAVACFAARPHDALAALARGLDVYLFLIGMMLLAECARIGGVFTWVAGVAVGLARGSRFGLFVLVFGAGIVTTAFLSNDATIVVLTPAVIEALRRIDATPRPYVVACALVANAASCVLPIANPANLLVFAGRMPALDRWLALFGLPTLAALAATFAVAALWYRRDLAGRAAASDDRTERPVIALAAGLLLAAGVIVAVSAREGPLGLATFLAALGVWAVAFLVRPAEAAPLPRHLSWGVVALTAALFVILGTLDTFGAAAATRSLVERCLALPAPWNAVALGGAVALISNLITNLPVGLNLGQTLPQLHLPPAASAAVLLGVNVGPNATVIGSLATLLWLAILRRHDIRISAAQFSAVGLTATVPALLAALLALR